jgi:hypothetical protein
MKIDKITLICQLLMALPIQSASSIGNIQYSSAPGEPGLALSRPECTIYGRHFIDYERSFQAIFLYDNKQARYTFEVDALYN